MSLILGLAYLGHPLMDMGQTVMNLELKGEATTENKKLQSHQFIDVD